jgi:hypothetical protein
VGRGSFGTDLTALGMTGCVLRVQPFLWLPSTGGGVFGLMLPIDPTLIGATLCSQAVVADPLANPFGAVLSDAMLARLGWR